MYLTGATSPDNKYRIEVKYTEAFTFGPSDIQINLFKDGQYKNIATTEISNDGKALNENNCNIKWDNYYAIISLNGEEQKEEIIKIDCELACIVNR